MLKGEVKVNNVQCSPSHAVIQGNQDGWTWLTLPKSMLTGPGHLLHLLVLRSSFSEDLLCAFPRKQSEANQLVDPWLVIALFEDRYNIHLFPQPFKNNGDDK